MLKLSVLFCLACSTVHCDVVDCLRYKIAHYQDSADILEASGPDIIYYYYCLGRIDAYNDCIKLLYNP